MQTLGAVIVSEHADLLESVLLWMRDTELFDQIVAVADVKGGPDTERVAHELADISTVMNVPHQGAVLDAAFLLCNTDWVFRMDDDERMGTLFVEGVRNLIERDMHDVYHFPRYWLWPDTTHYISNGCWVYNEDRQTRLWKRGCVGSQGSIDPGAVHVDLVPKPNSRTAVNALDWHIFHYVLLTPYEERLKKVARYAQIENVPLGDYRKRIGQFYLPEDSNNVEVGHCTEWPWGIL